jgi:hypothetical protein
MRTIPALELACAAVKANRIRELFSYAREKAAFDVAHGKPGSEEAVRVELDQRRMKRSGEGWFIKAGGTRFHVLVAVHALRLTRDAILRDGADQLMAAE